MARQSNPANADRRPLNVQVDTELFESASAVAAITNQTMQRFVTDALSRAIEVALEDGGTDLELALKVARKYRR